MLTIWDTKHIIFIASFNPSKQQYKLGTIEVGCRSLQWVCLPYSFECRSSGLLLIYALSLLQRVNGQGALQALLEEGSDIASQQDNAGSGAFSSGGNGSAKVSSQIFPITTYRAFAEPSAQVFRNTIWSSGVT